MDYSEAIQQRHSVRAYEDISIEGETLTALEQEIESCNRESGLHIQLIQNEPKAFDSRMAHYGKFSGVTNYVAMIGKKSPQLDELCGYYGEKIVLKAQMLGLNTCWVALTFKKIPGVFRIDNGEKLTVVIAVGYGKTQGSKRQSKSFYDVTTVDGKAPDWFQNGVEAALLAPTAVNQQKFHFTLVGDKVKAKAKTAFYSKLDLGIAKLHFELGSEKDPSVWI